MHVPNKPPLASASRLVRIGAFFFVLTGLALGAILARLTAG